LILPFSILFFSVLVDNLICKDAQPSMIDFDDCAWYWHVADIALALGDLFEDRAARVDLQHASFL
jgi:Ser/Thr protein kinase RdoA (MazF antagonist)